MCIQNISIYVVLLGAAVFGVPASDDGTCNQTQFPGASALVKVNTSLPNCSGIVIGPRHVVTSGICVRLFKTSPTVLNVYVGASSTNPMERAIKVKQVVVHSKFSDFPLNKNVALVELVSDLTPDDHIQPLELCTRALQKDDSITILRKHGEIFHEQSRAHLLLDVPATVISHSDCIKKHESVGISITDSMVCANEAICPGSESDCEKDKGQPVLYKGKLCGITSFGVNCGSYDYPEIYTSIDTVREVIAEFNRVSEHKLT